MRMRLALAIYLGVLLVDASLAAGSLRIVALSDDLMPAPLESFPFNHFAPPILNDAGQVAFLSGHSQIFSTNFSQHGSRAWSEGSGELALIAGRGSPAPGTPDGVQFSTFNQLGFNNAGKVVLRAELMGTGISGFNDYATYLETSAGLELISRTGDPAPGAPDGHVFGPLTHLILNDAGQIAFRVGLGPQTFFGNDSIWLGEVGTLDLLARVGSGSDPDAFGALGDPVLNNHGDVAFASFNPRAIWVGGPDNLRPVAQRGDPIPGSDNGEQFDFIWYPVINNSGHVAFYGTIMGPDVPEGSDRGIWSDCAGELHPVARTGEAAPGAPSGVVFHHLFAPVLNDAGRIAFWGRLAGEGVTEANDTGIWSDSFGPMALIAREGDPAPGLSGDLVFGEFGFNDYVLNAIGQIAFLGRIAGSDVTTANDTGIWASDTDGVLHLIARKGDLLEVRPDEFRTISELYFFRGTGNGDSRPSGFNNAGQLAFFARFTDMSEGIFVSNLVAAAAPIPEPATQSLLLLALAMLHTIARRRAPGR